MIGHRGGGSGATGAATDVAGDGEPDDSRNSRGGGGGGKRVRTTDLSDRHVQLCARDAILAVQRRVNELQMLDGATELHDLLSHDATALVAERCVLDAWTQRAFYDMLHAQLTALQHQTALRRHTATSRCNLADVLRVADIGQRVFLMIPMRWRGPFARVSRDLLEISRLSWQADAFDLVAVHQHVHLRSLGAPVAQLASWVRANQTKPIFFLLALSEEGRLEQLRICCKRAEPGLRRPDADDEVRVENLKDWRLEEALPPPPPPHAHAHDHHGGGGGGGGGGVRSGGGWRRRRRFIAATWRRRRLPIRRDEAPCVLRGDGARAGAPRQARRQLQRDHEHMYLDRFPAKVTSMSMCPQDNNIIAFGVPAAEADAAVAAHAASGGAGGGVVPASALHNVPAAPAAAPQLKPPRQRIELVNFAQSARIQTIPTLHEGPMLLLDYSPDSSQMISCSADTIQLWAKDPLERRGAGALDEAAAVTLRMPTGTSIHLVKVHPAWTSVLLATNDALEVRSLARATPPPTQTVQRDRRWRRQRGAPPLPLRIFRHCRRRRRLLLRVRVPPAGAPSAVAAAAAFGTR